MKNVRVWFEKDGAARYISHLDLNRCMTRAIHRSKIPVWYTEGFNPHPFMTFALPLSLGVHGRRESMDIRLVDEIAEQEIVDRLNRCLPKGIQVFAVSEPVMKPGRISYALYELRLTALEKSGEEIEEAVRKVIALPEIMVSKKSKSGIKEVDLKENLCKYELVTEKDALVMQVILPAGSTNNVNPQLLLDAVKCYQGIELDADITRLDLYNEEVERFC